MACPDARADERLAGACMPRRHTVLGRTLAIARRDRGLLPRTPRSFGFDQERHATLRDAAAAQLKCRTGTQRSQPWSVPRHNALVTTQPHRHGCPRGCLSTCTPGTVSPSLPHADQPRAARRMAASGEFRALRSAVQPLNLSTPHLTLADQLNTLHLIDAAPGTPRYDSKHFQGKNKNLDAVTALGVGYERFILEVRTVQPRRPPPKDEAIVAAGCR